MKVKDILDCLKQYPDDMEVMFLKYPSHSPLSFWDPHEWYICKKNYRKGGPSNEEFLAILVDENQ